jgi:predicted nucleic acid-binding Zn finger protein
MVIPAASPLVTLVLSKNMKNFCFIGLLPSLKNNGRFVFLAQKIGGGMYVFLGKNSWSGVRFEQASCGIQKFF